MNRKIKNVGTCHLLVVVRVKVRPLHFLDCLGDAASKPHSAKFNFIFFSVSLLSE